MRDPNNPWPANRNHVSDFAGARLLWSAIGKISHRRRHDRTSPVRVYRLLEPTPERVAVVNALIDGIAEGRFTPELRYSTSAEHFATLTEQVRSMTPEQRAKFGVFPARGNWPEHVDLNLLEDAEEAVRTGVMPDEYLAQYTYWAKLAIGMPDKVDEPVA